MTTYDATLPLAHPASDVFAWLERPGALERLTPPWEHARIIEKTGTVHDGDRVELKIGRTTLAMVHEGYEVGHKFVDRQERGPFRHWRHEHRVEPVGGARCELSDHIDYELPIDAIARHVAGGTVTRRLDNMFAYRAIVLAEDLARHAAFAAHPRMRIAVTGASGTIGRTLCAFLTTGGHEVVRLVRRAASGPDEIAWDPERGTIDAAALEGVDAVVHLAGENVGAGRWTEKRKREIMASRVGSTELVANAIAGLARKPSVYVIASAVGYYGEAPAGECDESSPPGDDFLAQVATAWEAAAGAAVDAGIRVVQARIGVALTPAGGALAEMARAFAVGIGGPIGAGTQPFPWVAADDVVYAIHHMLKEPALIGPVNIVAPGTVDNRAFAKTLGRVLDRPSFVRAPAFAIRLLLGEFGKVVLLGGQRVSSAALRAVGFEFSQPALEPWLRHVLGRTT